MEEKPKPLENYFPQRYLTVLGCSQYTFVFLERTRILLQLITFPDTFQLSNVHTWKTVSKFLMSGKRP